MKFFTLLLGVAFLAGTILAVNGKNANEEETKPSEASMLVAKPTEAPLMTSTVSPTRAPKTGPTPTKPMTIKASAKHNNAAKKSPPKVAASTEKKMDMKMTEKTSMVSEKEMKMEEAKPIVMPATVKEQKSMKEAKPLAVTGFITQNGNIYEIEDKNGMGKIQGRQADEEKEHVCNYGSVVIYSDVPCDQSSVKVKGVEERPALDAKPVSSDKPSEIAVDKEQLKPQANKETEDEDDLAAVRPVKRRRNNKRRNRNKNQQLQQQRRNKNRRNKNGLNRRQQQTRRQQQKRRQQQIRRQQQNRLQWQGDRRQFQNQRKRNQKRRQQAQLLEEYYDDDIDDDEDQYNRGRLN